MFDPFLITATSLLIITLIASILYYRRLKNVSEEYEKARSLLEDIIISFNKQLERDENKLAAYMQKTEALSTRNERIIEKLEAHEKQIIELQTTKKETLPHEIEELKKELSTIKERQESISQKILEIERLQTQTSFTEAKIEAAIPLRREKVLAPLTETELAVLEMLTNEGEKTAPEIKQKIGLTREHTARLMKKLYERGYVERNSTKVPYTYRIKEELIRLLKKAEAEA
ncbi:MAG: helix-turn-helix domain-containing protein [Candidatus Bathyarchaeia archaeon]